MTTKPAALTSAQLEVLTAISRGEVSKPAPGITYDTGTWRIGGNRGRAVTVPTESLIRKGCARLADAPVDGRLQAVPTAAGHEAISRAAHRAR